MQRDCWLVAAGTFIGCGLVLGGIVDDGKFGPNDLLVLGLVALGAVAVRVLRRPACRAREQARQQGYDTGYEDGKAASDRDALAFRSPAQKLGQQRHVRRGPDRVVRPVVIEIEERAEHA